MIKKILILLFLCASSALHAANYLTFTAEEDSSSFGRKKYSYREINQYIQYSLDNGQTWQLLPQGTTIILRKKGDKALLRRDISKKTINYYIPSDEPYFNMTGRIAASGSVMSLIDGTGETDVIPFDSYFAKFFANCTSLTQAPELPAKKLTKACFWAMFSGCKNLAKAPELPAIELAEECYKGMFSGCSSLTQAPELPAKKLAKACYKEMFSRCENLVKAPELPAIKLAEECYREMFSGCSSLTQAPELPAKKLAHSCYQGMFMSCTNLTQAPELPAKKLASTCYAEMFALCESLKQAPELPAKKLAEYCYEGMFTLCTNLTQAPQLPAKKLADECYAEMFSDCNSLTQAPELPATQLAKKCYAYMFAYSKSLVQAPQLPATKLMEECYMSMFEGCNSLTKAPELPATRLKDGCYKGMFRECIRLTHAPELPATTLPDQCYYNMFEDCISLPNAPYPSDTCVASPANDKLYGEKKKENGPMDTIDVLRVNQDTTHLKFNTNSIVHKYSFGRRFNRINDSKLEIETLDRQKRFFNCEGCTIARYSVDQKEGIAYLTSIDIVSDSKDDEAHLRTTTQDGELVSDITLNLSPSMTIHLSINDSLIKIDSIGPLPDIKKNDKLKLVAIADDGRKLKILQSSWWDDDRMGGTLDDVCTDDQIVNKTFMCLQKKRWKKTWVSIWVMAQESKKIWRPCLRFFWSPKE
ncbi:MAG: leucine-rich repeat protein [Paludibacteraceae bacterium]|nr:leucine-rich repeat protein [Paludibacteraceae bacterium]